MRSIHRAIQAGRLDARIALVLSNKEEAPGVQYARSQEIPTVVQIRKQGENRESYDRAMIQTIDQSGAHLVVLAGFMRILSPQFVAHYPKRIVNIHPSLLPKYPGLEAQRQALEAGEKVSGCTVHFVDEDCDAGPIIGQREVPILPEDNEATLSNRILDQEHQLYSEILQKIAEGKVKVEGSKVTID